MTTVRIDPFALQSITTAVSGDHVTVTLFTFGFQTDQKTFTCPVRAYTASSSGWTSSTAIVRGAANVSRSGNSYTFFCDYPVPAPAIRVTRPRPADITFATGGGFFRSADLTLAERQNLCSNICGTSCTAGFTGGRVDGIPECISGCIASCVAR